MAKEYWVALGVGVALLASLGVALLATRNIPAVEETMSPARPAAAPAADTRPARPRLETTRPPRVRATPLRVPPAPQPRALDRGQ